MAVTTWGLLGRVQSRPAQGCSPLPDLPGATSVPVLTSCCGVTSPSPTGPVHSPRALPILPRSPVPTEPLLECWLRGRSVHPQGRPCAPRPLSSHPTPTPSAWKGQVAEAGPGGPRGHPALAQWAPGRQGVPYKRTVGRAAG